MGEVNLRNIHLEQRSMVIGVDGTTQEHAVPLVSERLRSIVGLLR